MNYQTPYEIQKVRRLIESYMQQERIIILVIVDSTQDLAPNEVIELASKFDPLGERTLAVMTKADRIESGAEEVAIETLTNRRRPLRLGYVMLRNRTQEEVTRNISFAEARELEKRLFRENPFFSRFDPSLFGVDNLVEKLTSLLVARISASLPTMKEDISSMLQCVVRDLSALGEGPEKDAKKARMKLNTIASNFTTHLRDSCNGEYTHEILSGSTQLINKNAQELFRDFQNEILKHQPEDDAMLIPRIRTEIEDSRRGNLLYYPSASVFRTLMVTYVKRWENASRNLISDVHRMLHTATVDIFSSMIPGLPVLQREAYDSLDQTIQALANICQKEIDSLFRREKRLYTMSDQLPKNMKQNPVDVQKDAAPPAASSAKAKPGCLYENGILKERNTMVRVRSRLILCPYPNSLFTFWKETDEIIFLVHCNLRFVRSLRINILWNIGCKWTTKSIEWQLL